ncbi:MULTISPECIES: cupin domain-containing protein [unclassified Phenylobacterium]|uniref:cupin domain-containing protein n=1 Tax=unclassified Phenylobacterium TaxID=2640670 RepID=UPI000839DD16|nr:MULTISPECIES: cupin domain-containing protein [unclassified Phenylobacterium]
MRCALPLLALLISTPAVAQVPPKAGAPTVLDATLSGQAIRAPAGDLRVTVSQAIIPAGGRLAAHRHPYPRIVNVLAGRLRITNLDTGQTRDAVAGDWMVDAVEQWHEAVVVGDEPVRLLTIDQAPPGAAVTIPRNP